MEEVVMAVEAGVDEESWDARYSMLDVNVNVRYWFKDRTVPFGRVPGSFQNEGTQLVFNLYI
jgi:hypothetical protein